MVRRVPLAMVLGASLILLATGCATMGGKSSEADEAAVRAVIDEYAESVNTGNVELMASLWDEAGIRDRQNIPPDVGMAALRPRWEKVFTTYKSHMVINTQQLIVRGDLAFAHGLYTNEQVPVAGGAAVYTDAKFLTILIREPDGRWKIYADSCSSNVP